MRILVTGGAGFIGSNLVKRLAKENYEVIVIDDLSTGNLDNLKEVMDKIKFVRESVLNLDLLKKEFEGCDYIIHLAAIPSVLASVENPIKTNEANINGTLNVLTAARDCKVKRVVYSASSSRYGNSKEAVKLENIEAEQLSPYALQKKTGEEYCKLFYDFYGLETVSLIFFNVFGPNQDPNSPYSAVIPKFIKQIANDQRPIIYGDGTTSRDFTYVENNINAIISACTAENVAGGSFNIACGESISLISLADKINGLLNKKITPIFEDFRKGDIKHSLASISKAKARLNYKCEINFDEGLRRTIDYFTKS